MEQEILLSLILPAYNEEKRLPECMEKVAGFVAAHKEPIEVIIVEHGSRDRTYEMACRMFADVDFSMPISEVDHFIPPTLSDYQVAIGSREVKGAVRYNEPATRHFTGRVFNLIVRILLGLPNIHDTQCGFKSFSAEAAEKLFRVQQIKGWAFDAEVLFIAKHYGYKIVEVPVQWYYDGNSKINVIQDSVKMFRELLQIRKNYRDGLYK